LALHLTLIPESPRVIAPRAGIPLDTATTRLQEMDEKGLIFSIRQKDGTMHYRIQQFIIGFWEGQVNKLYPELVHDFEEYLDSFIDLDLWQKIPQLRTIPVEVSISVDISVLPYERAEKLIKTQTILAVNNCICRQEMHIIGKGCNRPVESCLSFGQAAERSIRQNSGRPITPGEAIEILKLAEKDGRVLQTSNARKVLFICTCCSCCCGALRTFKLDPNPAERISSPFVSCLNENTCKGCEICVDRCPMDAIVAENEKVILNMNRCIGCGLCVSTCSTGSLTLKRKAKAKQPYVPKTLLGTYVRLGHISGRMKLSSLIPLKVRSVSDRMKSSYKVK
jgi:electron transport complex protein RnfB